VLRRISPYFQDLVQLSLQRRAAWDLWEDNELALSSLWPHLPVPRCHAQPSAVHKEVYCLLETFLSLCKERFSGCTSRSCYITTSLHRSRNMEHQGKRALPSNEAARVRRKEGQSQVQESASTQPWRQYQAQLTCRPGLPVTVASLNQVGCRFTECCPDAVLAAQQHTSRDKTRLTDRFFRRSTVLCTLGGVAVGEVVAAGSAGAAAAVFAA